MLLVPPDHLLVVLAKPVEHQVTAGHAPEMCTMAQGTVPYKTIQASRDVECDQSWKQIPSVEGDEWREYHMQFEIWKQLPPDRQLPCIGFKLEEAKKERIETSMGDTRGRKSRRGRRKRDLLHLDS